MVKTVLTGNELAALNMYGLVDVVQMYPRGFMVCAQQAQAEQPEQVRVFED